jgi:hypothetical protein
LSCVPSPGILQPDTAFGGDPPLSSKAVFRQNFLRRVEKLEKAVGETVPIRQQRYKDNDDRNVQRRNTYYYWKGMSKDIKVFVGYCFHCIASAPDEATPRPMGEALHASKPNEVIHFDYLYMGPSVDDVKYVLLFKDDYSNYVWLKQCKNADAYSTAVVLI